MHGRARTIVVVAAVGAALLASGSAAATTGAGAASRSHAWGRAIEVPGTAALNQGGDAEVTSVSCGSPGNCSAGGVYTDSSFDDQAFVDSQAHGTWGRAIEVPGTAALNRGGSAGVASVSCASAGNCSAGGSYTDGSGRQQAFVVGQAHGTWGTAIEVPGTAALNQGGTAEVTSVSCGSAGNCSAGGFYQVDSSGRVQAFVVGQAHGTWGTAIEVPGTAALNRGGDAEVDSVSCASPGNCSAGGFYRDGSGRIQVFVVGQAHGTWGTAIEVPGTAALNRDFARVRSVSCGSPGNCSAGGFYTDGSGRQQAFVVGQAHGTWGTAIEVPGTAALNRGGDAEVDSVSCASAGNCSAGGFYTDSSFRQHAFVAGQAHGTWGTAIEVPGTAALNRGGSAGVASVSCASAGNCSAVGSYRDGSRRQQVFVAGQAHGTWGTAIEVPGTAALNRGRTAGVTSVSCASPGECSAGGFYRDGFRHAQAFVDSQT